MGPQKSDSLKWDHHHIFQECGKTLFFVKNRKLKKRTYGYAYGPYGQQAWSPEVQAKIASHQCPSLQIEENPNFCRIPRSQISATILTATLVKSPLGSSKPMWCSRIQVFECLLVNHQYLLVKPSFKLVKPKVLLFQPPSLYLKSAVSSGNQPQVLFHVAKALCLDHPIPEREGAVPWRSRRVGAMTAKSCERTSGAVQKLPKGTGWGPLGQWGPWLLL